MKTKLHIIALALLLCCTYTAVNARQLVQVNTIVDTIVDTIYVVRDGATAENNTRNEAYVNFLRNRYGGYLSLGGVKFHRYFSDDFSGREMFDLNLGNLNGELLVTFRYGYILGVNIVPNLNLQGFAALGLGSYGEDDDEDEFSDEEEAGFFDVFNALTLSFGCDLNFTRFYPLTLYLRAETMGIAGMYGSGFFTTYGGGIKYAFRAQL